MDYNIAESINKEGYNAVVLASATKKDVFEQATKIYFKQIETSPDMDTSVTTSMYNSLKN